MPSSNGVSAAQGGSGHEKDESDSMYLRDAPGPKMTAFHSMMLSGHGLPEIPPGGSLDSRLKSRIRRLLQFVDYEKTGHQHQLYEGMKKIKTDHDSGYG